MSVLYYQAWADAANYEIKKRRPCMSKEYALVCQITVVDDFGETLGYMATDTFSLVVENQKVTGVQFEGDDPPIFMKLFEWISINRAEIMSGPCLNMFAGGYTPRKCARAVVSAAILFLRGSKRANPFSSRRLSVVTEKEGVILKIHRQEQGAFSVAYRYRPGQWS